MYDYLIKWTDANGTESVIRDAIDVRVTINTEAESDSAEILLPYRNYVLNGDINFTTGESLAIYMKNDGLLDSENLDSTDLIFTATIEDFERQMSSGILKLICVNLTYELLSSLFNQNVTAKPNEIVELVIQNASADGVNQVTTSTNIQSLKSDGTDFEDIEYVSAWNSSYDCISELAGTGNTGDDQTYIFWFDADGTFNWIYPPSDVETLEISYGDGIKDIKHTKDDITTVAMVIYNAGPDLNGTDTYGFKYNNFAENIKGAVKYYPMTDISKLLVASDYSTDNNEFIAEQKRLAEIEADAVINKYSGGVDKTTCTLTGRQINISKLHKVSSPMFPEKELRLIRVVHTFNRNGWSTKLELEEDATETTYEEG